MISFNNYTLSFWHRECVLMSSERSCLYIYKHGGGGVSWSGVAWVLPALGSYSSLRGTMNANMYCDILKQTMIPSFRDRGRRAVFKHDNDPKHTSKMTTALIKKMRVKVICGQSSNGRWRRIDIYIYIYMIKSHRGRSATSGDLIKWHLSEKTTNLQHQCNSPDNVNYCLQNQFLLAFISSTSLLHFFHEIMWHLDMIFAIQNLLNNETCVVFSLFGEACINKSIITYICVKKIVN